MKAMKTRILLGIVALLGVLLGQEAQAFYNSCTGRWLSRDPIGEKGGVPLTAFVANSPANSVDALGHVARGACMLMSCLNPCEKFRQMRARQERYVSSGGIVCCGGVKYVCTWGADLESHPRVKQIMERCIRDHERLHLPKESCPDCECGVTPVRQRPMRELCQDEVVAHAASVACYEAALAECGDDQVCSEKVKALIKASENKRNFYQQRCNDYSQQ